MGKDNIELPPLPEPFTYVSPNVERNPLFHTRHMQDFARAAIKADRQQRGEPVYTLNVRGALHDYTPTVAAFDIPDGRHSLYIAPQPAAPTQEPSDDEILSLMIGSGPYFNSPANHWEMSSEEAIGFARALLARYGSKS